MVGRGAVWVPGLALALAACGGRVLERSDDDGGESGTGSGGRAGTGNAQGGSGSVGEGGRVGKGGGTAGVMTPGAGRMGGGGSATGGSVSQGGIAGTSGTAGTCEPYESQGGRTGADGCPIPWWGASLEGTKGLLSCAGAYDRAILAYGQSNIPLCIELVGPVAESNSSTGAHECCYEADDRACCGSVGGYQYCVPLPFFGDGTRVTELPRGQVDDPFYACDGDPPEPLELTAVEKADRLIGVWLACSGAPIEPFRGQGFVFRGDGTFHAVELTDDINVVETKGCMQGGLWGFLPETGQLNLHIEDFTQFHHPTFTDPPNERLVIDGRSFVRARVPSGG